MSKCLLSLLGSGKPLLADGATGTNLFTAGLRIGDVPELWNTEHPERVAVLHAGFVTAGADVILTNSFGANRYRLGSHHAGHRVVELNEAAARLARAEADRAGRVVAVGGSMGPTGEILAPLGPLVFENAVAAFAEQAQALARGGADVLWLETLAVRAEIEAAVAGAASTGLPLVVTVSFDGSGRTRDGLAPAAFAALVQGLRPRPCAWGSNCGVDPAESVASTAGPDAVLVAKSNCGLPRVVDGGLVYELTPAQMAGYLPQVLDAGARIVGGCCGTRPARDASRNGRLAPRFDAYARAPRRDRTSGGNTAHGLKRRRPQSGRPRRR